VLHTTLTEMGCPRLEPTPVATDNTTAVGIANDTIQQRRSKAIDIRFYWVRDRVAQKHFIIQWPPGSTNLDDYHTKTFAGKHHQLVRSIYLHEPTSRRTIPQSAIVGLQGCVNSPVRPTPVCLFVRNPMTQTTKTNRETANTRMDSSPRLNRSLQPLNIIKQVATFASRLRAKATPNLI
jgi:hypothetical protein